MSTLAGIVCIRNGFRLDYCWREAGKSLLGVCDELVLCDCESDDGTRQAMDEWAAKDSRITLAAFPWTNPIRDNQWYPEWVNYARQHAKSEHIIHLDADEVVHEYDWPVIRRAADANSVLFCRRLNFWKDAQHLIPDGFCCGTKVLRIAPSNMPIPSDYPYGPAEPTMAMAIESNIRVFHYGFIRPKEAFFRKARVVQTIWSGGLDSRLESAEKFDGHWATAPGVTGWEDNLNPYNGSHPKAAHQWLKERGYDY